MFKILQARRYRDVGVQGKEGEVAVVKPEDVSWLFGLVVHFEVGRWNCG